MEEEVIGLIRDSLADLKETCQGIRDDMAAHTEKDAHYWRKIDQQEGQISMLKIIAGAVGGGFAMWEGIKRLWH